MATNSVNFFQPGTDAAVDANAIARQRQIAELLSQQGRTPAQGQMVSGHYVAPGAASYVAQLVSALGGAYAGRQADERERALGRSLAATRAKEVGDFIAAGRGTPGQPARDIQPLTPNDDEGNPMPVARADAVPAQAPDTARQLAIAMQSQNPMLQQAGGQMLTQQMADARRQSIMQSLGMGGQPAPGGAPGPGGGAPAAGAGMGGLDPRAIALMISGDPELAKLGGVMNDAAKPVALREGDLVRPDANGNFRSVYSQPKLPAGMVPTRDAFGGVTGAQVLPGFNAGNAAIVGAEAQARQGAESQNTIVTIDTPQGPRMVTRAQAVQMSGGRAPAVVPNPGLPNPTEAAMGRNAVINDDPSADAEREIAALRGDLNKVPDAASKQMIQAEIDRLTAQVQKYSGAGGGRGAVNPTGPGIPLQSESDKQYDTARAKDFAKAAADYQDKARGAGGMLRNLDTLEQLYKDPNVAKGGMAESISGLKNMGASLGVETKGLGAEQAIEAITNKMALDARSTAEGGGMPGAMSDADRNFLKAQQPGLSKTPEGRAAIIANGRKLAQRQVQIAQMANEYERTNGRLDAGFDRLVADFANQNQMFADQKAPSAVAPVAAPDFKSLAAQELARRRAKNGG